MIRTQVTFTQEQIDLLKEAAFRQDTSIAAIVRGAVDERFRKTKTVKKRKARNVGEELLAIVARTKEKGRRGPRDLSAQVDHYLYGTPKK